MGPGEKSQNFLPPYAVCLHNKIFGRFYTKNFGRFLQFSAKFFCLKIARNENFIMQTAYGDKKLFKDFLKFTFEKIDFLVKIPLEREVVWFFSRVQTIKILKTLKPEGPMVVLSKSMSGSSLQLHEGSTPLWATCVLAVGYFRLVSLLRTALYKRYFKCNFTI